MTKIDRRMAGCAILGGAVAALAACKSNDAGNAGASVDDALAALSSAISGLQSEVGRFGDEDWKDVVPNVQANATDVADAFSKLKEALGKG